MKKIYKKDLFAYIGYIFLLLKFYIESSEIFYSDQYILSLIQLIAYLFLIVEFILNYKKNKTFIIDIFFIICSIIVYFKTGSSQFLTLILMLVSTKSVEINNLIKLAFVFGTLFVIVHIIIYVLFMFYNIKLLNIPIRMFGKIPLLRCTYFMSHPNLISLIIFWLFAMYTYIYYDKIKKEYYLCGLIISFFIFMTTNSRSCTLIMIFLIFMIYLSKKKNIFRNKNIFKYFILVINLILVCFIFIANLEVIGKIDDIFSSRISIAYIMYKNYGFNLFGSNISNGTPISIVHGAYISSLTIIDSVPYSLLLNSGIIAYGYYIYIMYKISSSSRMNNLEMILILTFIFYGITETNCLNAFLGFPILFLNKEN